MDYVWVLLLVCLLFGVLNCCLIVLLLVCCFTLVFSFACIVLLWICLCLGFYRLVVFGEICVFDFDF